VAADSGGTGSPSTAISAVTNRGDLIRWSLAARLRTEGYDVLEAETGPSNPDVTHRRGKCRARWESSHAQSRTGPCAQRKPMAIQ
jgi:hypothetical protein